MFTSPDAPRFPVWTRWCLSLLACTCLLTQVQCSGGSDSSSDNSIGSPPAGNGPTDTTARTIAQENTLPGTRDWLTKKPALNGELSAYPDRESYAAGSDVRISVSANPPGQFSWEAFRMGGYRGMGGRSYAQGGPLVAPRQTNRSFDQTTGLFIAGWPATFTISTRDPANKPWLTGVYLVLLTKDDGLQTYATFILRDDTRDAEVAVHVPTATYQAYNDFGGDSLYVSTHGLSGGKARKVSLDRPIAPQYNYGSGTFLSQEHEAVIWLEDHGYDVEYLASVDIGGENGRIGAHRLFMLVGHEEYATMAELDRLEAALARGTSLAFLTGNTMYWQIRYEDHDQIIVCYKDQFAEDPLRDTPLAARQFRDVGRPENELLGVMSDGSHTFQPADWVVTNPDHWIYQGTGVSEGQRIPELVFTEWDGLVDNGRTPQGITVLASSVVPNPVTPASRHESTIYERGRAFVFAAGSIYFSQHVRSQPVVGQMVSNLLARAGATAYQP